MRNATEHYQCLVTSLVELHTKVKRRFAKYIVVSSGIFNQEKALVGAFSVIVQLRVTSAGAGDTSASPCHNTAVCHVTRDVTLPPRR